MIDAVDEQTRVSATWDTVFTSSTAQTISTSSCIRCVNGLQPAGVMPTKPWSEADTRPLEERDDRVPSCLTLLGSGAAQGVVCTPQGRGGHVRLRSSD